MQNPYTILRVHRGGGNTNHREALNDRFYPTKSASVRGRCTNQSPSPRTTSFRQKRVDSARGKESIAISVQRKKSSSMSTLNIFVEPETQKKSLEALENESNWVTKLASPNLSKSLNFNASLLTSQISDTSKVIIETEKTENVQILNPYGNGFYPEMNETNIIEKSADSAIWYPAVLTSLLVGKRTKKYSDRYAPHTPDQNNSRHSIRTELRVARTIGIVVGCFTVCWLPFTVIYILQVNS